MINRLQFAILVVGLAIAGSAYAQAQITLPRAIRGTLTLDYPPTARRLNQQGRVLIEFAISPAGHVVDGELVSEEPNGFFGSSLLREIDGWRFHVPSDWESSGGSKRRFRISFVFTLKPCPTQPNCTLPVAYDADKAITVTARAIPAAH